MARFGAKAEEPRVTCPVCGDTEKASSNEGNGMCSRCWDYLSPVAGGTDHGVFMVRVRTSDDGRRSAEIRPRGFWSGTIEVRERIDHSYIPETKEIQKDWKVDVSWGSGGTDGTHDEIVPGQFQSYAENFANAMYHAVNLAKLWKMERQEKKEA
ncbi:MAG: hypothetical protein IH577_01885 [Deltaproteobacteria bacterium]|nr:hypothetical protein [Deltaproteobacteria bacterium]